MTKVSELIGTILETADITCTEIEGQTEQYNIIPVQFKHFTIDVVISSFVYTGVRGKVKITGRLCSENVKSVDGKRQRHFYIYANDIRATEPDTPDQCDVFINAKITKVGDFLVTYKGLEVMFVYGTELNPMGGTSIFKLCLNGEAARECHNINTGDYIKATGTITPYKDSIELIITELDHSDTNK